MQTTARKLDSYTLEDIVKSVLVALNSQQNEQLEDDVTAPIEIENTAEEVHETLDGYPPVLNAKHVRQFLGVSEAFAYEVLNSASCPTIRMGKRMVVPKDSFLRFLKESEGKRIF
jgi:hypothetical protein